MDPEQKANQHEPVRFRPSKKRKTYRHRDTDQYDDGQARSEEPSQPTAPAEANRSPPLDRAVASDFFGGGAGARDKAVGDKDDEEAADDMTSPPPPPLPLNGKPADADDQPASVAAAAIRLRNARKARARAGVNFGTHSSSTTRLDPDDASLALRDPEAASLSSMADRFTQQTGLIRYLDDRHMNEYIESRLSSRAVAATNSSTQEQATSSTQAPTPLAPANRGQSIMVGKLMEVDLPLAPSSRAPDAAPPPSKKQRLGPDGKPWRGRRRRGSDDIKRDQLVEEFLHENKLDVYDMPEPSKPEPSADDAGGDADERLAEEFRRQFMDDMAARRQKKKKPAQTTTKAKNEDVLRGPKLGGSRNSRAAVRDILLKKEKEAKK